jgi:hypothetical protein
MEPGAPPRWAGLSRALRLAACGAAPGLLLGAHLAGLIFYLNPDLPFSAGPVFNGFARYGLVVGTASLVVHQPLFFWRGVRAQRVLPWSLAISFAVAAWLDGLHASRFAFYLPPGINDRLIKTAFWLGLAALITFYTALLHTLHRRPYGARSRWGLAFLALLTLAVAIERREAYRSRPAPLSRPAFVEEGDRPRLWVVGLDAATLDAILPLAGAGRLPFFSTLLRDGSYARLATLTPTRREALWSTLATGKYPFQHGVTGWRVYPAPYFCSGCVLRLLPIGIRFGDWGLFGERGQLEPDHARRSLALWEVVGRLGVESGVVGWPRSGAGGSGEGFVVPERLFLPDRPGVPGWPPGVESLVAGDQRTAGASTEESLVRLPESTRRHLAGALAADRWRLAVTRDLLARKPKVEATFLLLPGLGVTSRRTFGGFSAVQFDGSRRREARQASDVLTAYYAALDDLLREIWSLRSGEQILAVVSVHGARTAQGWERLIGGVSTSRSVEGHFQGAPDGALLLYGAGIKKGALLTGARLVDAAPTLMYALGLPLARDLDGRVLTGAFEADFLARNAVTFLPAFEGLRRQAGLEASGR